MENRQLGVNGPIGYGSPPLSALWQPGVSPNPGGAPRGVRLTTLMARALDMSAEELDIIVADRKRPEKERAAARWALQIGAGEDRARDAALDRLEGAVTQRTVIIPGQGAAALDAGAKERLARAWLANQAAGVKRAVVRAERAELVGPAAGPAAGPEAGPVVPVVGPVEPAEPIMAPEAAGAGPALAAGETEGDL